MSRGVDWPYWLAFKTIPLWQAIALTLGLDPDALKPSPHGWMAGPGSGPIFEPRSFPSADAEKAFDRAMRLAVDALDSEHGPLHPQRGGAQDGPRSAQVLLAEVAAYALQCNWGALPEPLQTLVAPAKAPGPAVAPLPAARRTPGWALRSPERFQGYNRPLYELLKAAHTARQPRPTARDVLAAWKLNRPSEVREVLPDELKYDAADGTTKVADLAALRKAIDRLTSGS